MVDTIGIAQDAFTEIFLKFPSLTIIENKDDPVEISLTLPVQEGLKYKIWLCLQNRDELHFSVGSFWCAWFPCTDPDKVRAYIDSVHGFLSGKHRILEHYRGKHCVKAELQEMNGTQWQTIVTSSRLWSPVPWKKTYKQIQN
jgi:hypothetical protein